jgi:hypothetical protein
MYKKILTKKQIIIILLMFFNYLFNKEIKMSLNAIATGLVTLCDVVNLGDSLHKIYCNPNENRGVRIASILSRLSIIGFQTGASIAQIREATPETLGNIKSGELLCRFIDLPIRMSEEASQMDVDSLRFLEKAVVAPMSDIIRVGSEVNVHNENHYLQEYKRDPQKAKRPVYEQCGDEIKIVGYRRVEPKECEENINSSRQTAVISAGIRIASEAGIGSKAVQVSCDLYESLALWIRAKINGAPLPQQQGQAINLIALNEIPEPLEGDIVFRRYICPITNKPIRDPVGDPNGHTLYERSAIMTWLNRGNYTSPVTRLPLRPSQLIEKPVLKKLIESRLTYHGQHLWEYLQINAARLNTPVDPAVQAAVDQENPHN